jgi:hypothetical protein
MMIPFIRRIPADICLPTFILEINLRLIQRRLEQIIGVHTSRPLPVGGQILSQSSRSALPQVIQFCFFQRQKFGQGQ